MTAIFFSFNCNNEIDTECGYANVNGTKLYYEIAGKGETIVLIHGNLGDNRYWDEQFKSFAKKFKVIRYDVRGFGKSSLPKNNEQYGHHDDLKALLGYFGISKAHVAGFSMGCGLAIDFVLAYPKMSNSLIAVGPWVMGYTSASAENFFKEFGKTESILKRNGKKQAAEYFINAPFFNPQRMNSKLKNQIAEIVKDYTFWHWLNKDQCSYVSPPAVQRLDQINLPTLIITAAYDVEACREIADLLEKSIPNAKKIVIAKATHFMLMEKPAVFNKGVLRFLSQVTN